MTDINPDDYPFSAVVHSDFFHPKLREYARKYLARGFSCWREAVASIAQQNVELASLNLDRARMILEMAETCVKMVDVASDQDEMRQTLRHMKKVSDAIFDRAADQ